jgi:hypothetical protein
LQKTLTSCESTARSLSRPPPETKPQVAARTSVVTVLELSCRPIPTVLVQRPVDPLKGATALRLLAPTVRSSLIATLAAEAATAEAPTRGPTGGLVAEATAAAEATRTATSPEPHRAVSTPARRLKNCGGRSPPPQATTTASPPSLLGFATCSSRKNSNLWNHLVRREARSHPVAQMLRPLHREHWWQQRHQVPLLPLLSGPSPAHMARVTRKVLDRQVGLAEGPVHQQLCGRYGPLGYSHGPSYGEAGTGQDPPQVHAAFL